MDSITDINAGRAALRAKAQQDFDDAMARSEAFALDGKQAFAKQMLELAKAARARITKYSPKDKPVINTTGAPYLTYGRGLIPPGVAFEYQMPVTVTPLPAPTPTPDA